MTQTILSKREMTIVKSADVIGILRFLDAYADEEIKCKKLIETLKILNKDQGDQEWSVFKHFIGQLPENFCREIGREHDMSLFNAGVITHVTDITTKNALEVASEALSKMRKIGETPIVQNLDIPEKGKRALLTMFDWLNSDTQTPAYMLSSIWINQATPIMEILVRAEPRIVCRLLQRDGPEFERVPELLEKLVSTCMEPSLSLIISDILEECVHSENWAEKADKILTIASKVNPILPQEEVRLDTPYLINWWRVQRPLLSNPSSFKVQDLINNLCEELSGLPFMKCPKSFGAKFEHNLTEERGNRKQCDSQGMVCPAWPSLDGNDKNQSQTKVGVNKQRCGAIGKCLYEILRLSRNVDLLMFLPQGVKRYRGHDLHQFNTALLGLFFLETKVKNNLSLAGYLASVHQDQFSTPDDVKRTWLLASLLHDHALAISHMFRTATRIYEIKESTNASRSYKAAVLDVQKALRLVYSDLFSIPLCKIYRKFIRKSPYSVISLQKLISDEMSRIGLNKVTENESSHFDHGVLAAANMTSRLQSLDKIVEIAAKAVAMHNLNENEPVSFNKDPLAFLLILCDELQDWGREIAVFPEILMDISSLKIEGFHIDHGERFFGKSLSVSFRFLKNCEATHFDSNIFDKGKKDFFEESLAFDAPDIFPRIYLGKKEYSEGELLKREPHPETAKIASIFEEEKVKRILDLGCGCGEDLVYLSRKGFDVYGLDLAQAGLAHALSLVAKEGLTANLALHDMSSLPYDDGYFDAVISIQVIHHNKLEGIKKTIEEIKRVLKSGGFVWITMPLSKNESRSEQKEIEPGTFLRLNGPEKGLPHHYFSKEEIRTFFQVFQYLIFMWILQITFHY